MLNTQRLLARRLTVPFGIVLRELLYIWALYKIVFHLLFYIYTILLYVSAQVPLAFDSVHERFRKRWEE